MLLIRSVAHFLQLFYGAITPKRFKMVLPAII